MVTVIFYIKILILVHYNILGIICNLRFQELEKLVRQNHKPDKNLICVGTKTVNNLQFTIISIVRQG
jgi:hypothetical protein